MTDNKHTVPTRYDQAIANNEWLISVEGRSDLASELAGLYMNKGNVISTSGDQRGALGFYDRAVEILDRLVNVEGRSDLANSLAMVYFNLANATSDKGDNLAAMALYDRASEILGRLVDGDGRSEAAPGDLAWVRAYRGVALTRLGKIEEGKNEASSAIAAMRAEVKRTGRADLQRGIDWTARQLGLPGAQE